jgi:molecular chaperone HtpG
MDGLLPKKLTLKLEPFVGYQLLDIITGGMYDDPLMVYREYIQNAVDSIDVAVREGILSKGQGAITIEINGTDRAISIEDNGVGLRHDSAANLLLNIGFSPKDGAGQRGFRGIGRLGGLAYCDLLRFTTRTTSQKDVTVVEWDRNQLDGMPKEAKITKSLAQIVKDTVRVYQRKATPDELDHFFRVEMQGVRRFHSDKLMSVKAVRDYLGQVAPVPYDKSLFSHADRITEHFSDVPGYLSYQVTMNGKKVTRPYSDKIQVSTNFADEIKDVRLFEFSGNKIPLAKGWYAVIDYRGALPISVPMRGIRVRQGNIQIGDEYILASYYLERRFATWTIGEIHICDYNIRPNARRDSFEQTREYESFLEQASILGRLLSQLCRKSSKARSNSLAVIRRLEEIESRLNSLTFFLDEEHRQSILTTSCERLENIKRLIALSNDGELIRKKYSNILTRVDELSDNALFLPDILDKTDLDADSIEIIGKILKALQKEYNQCSSIEDLMHRVLKPFLIHCNNDR